MISNLPIDIIKEIYRKIKNYDQCLNFYKALPLEIRHEIRGDFWEHMKILMPLVALYIDKRVFLFKGKENINIFNHEIRVNVIKFRPNTLELFVGCINGKIYIWDISSGHFVREMKVYSGIVRIIEFTEDGRYMVVSGNKANLYLWDLFEMTSKEHSFMDLFVEDYFFNYNPLTIEFSKTKPEMLLTIAYASDWEWVNYRHYIIKLDYITHERIFLDIDILEVPIKYAPDGDRIEYYQMEDRHLYDRNIINTDYFWIKDFFRYNDKVYLLKYYRINGYFNIVLEEHHNKNVRKIIDNRGFNIIKLAISKNGDQLSYYCDNVIRVIDLESLDKILEITDDDLIDMGASFDSMFSWGSESYADVIIGGFTII